MHCCRRGQTAWILMVFPNSVLLGQNLAEILFLLWLAFWTNKLQKHNWKRIPYGIAEKNSKKTQRLTHFWPKARSSFFSELTVRIYRASNTARCNLDLPRVKIEKISSLYNLRQLALPKRHLSGSASCRYYYLLLLFYLFY